MELIKSIEKSLENLFKDLPHLPEKSRKSLADFWPVLALIVGVLQLFAAWSLYNIANWAERVNNAANSLSAIYNVDLGPTDSDKNIIYLGILILVVNAVILLMAYPKLKEKLRSGWNLLFLAALINVAYAVTQLFLYDRGPNDFVFSLLGSAIGFYLLFEIKSKFVGKDSAT